MKSNTCNYTRNSLLSFYYHFIPSVTRNKVLREAKILMQKTCAICKKSSIRTWKLRKLRGKYNPTIKRRKYPNLQWLRLPAGKADLSSGKRVLACAKCIKATAKT